MNKLRTLAALLVFGAVGALFTPGCGNAAADVCDAKCDCERCPDREYSECEIEVNNTIDNADAYGCSDQYAQWEDCALAKSVCRNEHWGLDHGDCSGEAKILNDCIEDNSALR